MTHKMVFYADLKNPIFVIKYFCLFLWYNLSRVMRKHTSCKCKNKGEGQLRAYHLANQRLSFHFVDITIPLLPKS